MTPNEKNAIKMLKHIQLELDSDSPFNKLIRDFVDPWYCYKHNYTSKNGTATWAMLTGTQWVTDDFLEIDENDWSSQTIVTKEHIVPLKVIIEEVLKTDLSLESIEATLNEFLIYASITKEEDKKLSKAGLGSKMPDEYYDPQSIYYMDKFSRYKIAGIKLKKM